MNLITKIVFQVVVVTSMLLILGGCTKKEEVPEPEKKPEVIVPEEELVIIPELSDEVMFEQIHNKLQNEGFTVSEPLQANLDMFQADTGMTLVVNGESLLPLHIYKLSPTDSRLPVVDQTGNIEVRVGSKLEPLAVKRMDHFIIFLHKGHPDYAEIMQTIK
ncbi:hypothetical protein DV702_06440 [Sporosarcina sp. PTS2304]|uniref:hypothetical protein n=1 Tax=Sporosarcina sp. PTS2304 TaxID=2283194 RepID=UPI000E0CEE5C|nr:hypothetical protein [Sporosarcina sp. PTS2304]AXH99412.1 hypothetical protein DV702_06440 [Sporosarcina sp. PTS2304]